MKPITKVLAIALCLVIGFFSVPTDTSGAQSKPPPLNTFYCDRIEMNIYCDEYFIPIFCQTIFQDFNPDYNVFEVRAWRLTRSVWDKSDLEHFAAFKKDIEEYCKRYNKGRLNGMINSKRLIDKYKGKFNPGIWDWAYKNYDTGKYEYKFLHGGIETEIYTVITKYPPVISYTQYDKERRQRDAIPEDFRIPLFEKNYIKNQAWYYGDENKLRIMFGGEPE